MKKLATVTIISIIAMLIVLSIAFVGYVAVSKSDYVGSIADVFRDVRLLGKTTVWYPLQNGTAREISWFQKMRLYAFSNILSGVVYELRQIPNEAYSKEYVGDAPPFNIQIIDMEDADTINWIALDDRVSSIRIEATAIAAYDMISAVAENDRSNFIKLNFLIYCLDDKDVGYSCALEQIKATQSEPEIYQTEIHLNSDKAVDVITEYYAVDGVLMDVPWR